jgi:hypothetical protein
VVVKVNSSCSSTAVQQGDSQISTGQDGTKRRRDTGQGKAADETGRGRRAGNGAGTELKRGGCAMPSSSAPCQPASSRQSSPPVKSSQVQAPDLQKICETEGTSTRHRTRLRQTALRGRASGGQGRKRAG